MFPTFSTDVNDISFYPSGNIVLPKFVIWAPSYDETNGGTIVLHALCDRLVQLGVQAGIWADRKASPHQLTTLRGQLKRLAEPAIELISPYESGPFPNRVLRGQELAGAVVLYPEIVPGNPLGAQNVVRWLLHRPGFHTGRAEFGENDLFFFYQETFDDPTINPDRDNLLRISLLHPAYKQANFQARSGAAYIVRKGKHRELNQHPSGAIRVDGLSHSKTASIFNQVKYFYSYDPYTLYSLYAALCGCVSIIIPEAGVDRHEWLPEESRRFGLAYGPEDEQWAVATMPALFHRLSRERAAEDELVRSFVRKCADKFSCDTPPFFPF